MKLMYCLIFTLKIVFLLKYIFYNFYIGEPLVCSRCLEAWSLLALGPLITLNETQCGIESLMC